MSHYLAFVLIPADGDPESLVEEIMAPFNEELQIEQCEEDGETYWRNPHGFWDGWQIGGRWMGTLSGYDPNSDPAMLEECWLCHGTGMRNDDIGKVHRLAHPDYTCNGCKGTGKRAIWPSQRPARDGDVQDAMAVAVSPIERTPYTFLVHGAETVHHREEFRWIPDDPNASHHVELMTEDGMRKLIRFTINARVKAGLTGDRIAVVDYHS